MICYIFKIVFFLLILFHPHSLKEEDMFFFISVEQKRLCHQNQWLSLFYFNTEI